MAPSKNKEKKNRNVKPKPSKSKRTKEIKEGRVKKIKMTNKWKKKGTEIKPDSIKIKAQVLLENQKCAIIASKESKLQSLRERMMKRLEAAKFRQVNEELDSIKDTDPKLAFHSDISNFKKYHTAYKERLEHWPQNPLDVMINYIKRKVPLTHIVADFGCGEARLAASVQQKTHSFDLFAMNERVTACDMSSTPLTDQSVDVAIFCLSLMGTEVGKYIAEASRVLKIKGILKIAEVASRFLNNDAGVFIKRMKKFGFIPKDRVKEGNKNGANPTEVFLLLEFIKIRPIRMVKGKLPSLRLSPCAYKKR